MYAPEQRIEDPQEEEQDDLEEIKDASAGQNDDNIRYYNPSAQGLTEMQA